MELKKIVVEEFVINNNIKNKNTHTFNLDKGKIIITGNNGTGKTSLLNLIFGIIKSTPGLYSHVRYEKIEFEFVNKKVITLNSNKKFQNIASLIKNNGYSSFIKNIKDNFKLINKWSYLFEDKKFKKRISNYINNDEEDINEFILFMQDGLNDKENPFGESSSYEKISERSHIINIVNAIPLHFFNRVLNNIIQQVNIINSSIVNENGVETKKIQEIKKFLENKIEYFSSFRNAKEFIENTKEKYNINENNLDLISFELDKKDINQISEELIKRIEQNFKDLKLSFFKNISENNWNNEKVDSETFISLSKKINDKEVQSLVKKFGKCANFKKRIEGYITPFIKELEKIKKFEEDISNFVEKINDCLINKSIIYEENKFFIKNDNNFKKPFLKEQLSAGEKQMFILLQTLILSKKEIIIIDEPENSLSIIWQQILRDSINHFINKGKKIIIVTHSPYMITKEDIEKKAILKIEERSTDDK